jgi:beta-glucosidase
MNSFELNTNILLGASSAATQIEGGSVDHNWLDWHKRGRIKDGTTPERACDHWKRWRQDCELLRDLGIQTYRLGVEWARIEPRQGFFDEAALAQYREELELLASYGIKPLVTLHHFSDPMWFVQKGGFTKVENIDAFLNFVERTVNFLGPAAAEYITINEPNVYACNGWFFGEFPPGKRSFSLFVRIMAALAAAHIQAYGLIHSTRDKLGLKGTKVGFAHAMRVFAPQNSANPSHNLVSRLDEYLFQGCVSRAFLLGDFRVPLRNLCRLGRGAYADFLGVNYYSRSTVSGFADGVRGGVPVNDLGWEIYPPGITEVCQTLHNLLPLPIYITENGTCDNADRYRSRFIYEHLRELAADALPVERYYHWSFTDNFEWCEGESARFGLVHMNYDTQERTIKKSGRFYSEIIQRRGVTSEMFAEYVDGERYPQK